MSSSVEAIIVKSEGGDEFKMSFEAAMQSKLLKGLVGDVSVSDDCKVPITEVKSDILVKVIEYCEKHAAKANDGASDDSDVEELRGWDEEFMKVDSQATLFNILMAADYLQIEGLFGLACQTIADSMKGKNSKEIRNMFGIKNDFSPEEKERLRRQNPSLSID